MYNVYGAGRCRFILHFGDVTVCQLSFLCSFENLLDFSVTENNNFVNKLRFTIVEYLFDLFAQSLVTQRRLCYVKNKITGLPLSVFNSVNERVFARSCANGLQVVRLAVE